jgi:hypothetical protein
MRYVGVALSFALFVTCRLAADTVLLGDISYQPGDPITGLTDIVLDNFTDLPDLGCSSVYQACSGLNISGSLSFNYLDSMNNSLNFLVNVASTGPGSTAIYEFDPTQITFVSAVLTGTISPASFLLNDNSTFVSDGSFISDTLTGANGFASISVSQASAVPEPAHAIFLVLGLLAVAVLLTYNRRA